jgi:uncharacterized protein (TIGR00297 family)
MTGALFNGLLATACAVPFALLAIRSKVLTAGGALMAGGIGIAVVIAQGWLWLLPLFLFLLSGVLLGKLNRGARTDEKHGKPRDAMQVFCSGGIYALLACRDDLSRETVWMSISICVAACDTWASEIGMFAKWPTWNLATLRRVEPGYSGGVSLAGSLGGLLGALLMAVLCRWLVDPGEPYGSTFVWSALFAIQAFAVGLFVAFAMAGMLMDSLMGALLQVKYNDGRGVSDSGVHRVSGLAWMTNDVVNLLSNAAVVALAMWLL